jgi:hypothetical protein
MSFLSFFTGNLPPPNVKSWGGNDATAKAREQAANTVDRWMLWLCFFSIAAIHVATKGMTDTNVYFINDLASRMSRTAEQVTDMMGLQHVMLPASVVLLWGIYKFDEAVGRGSRDGVGAFFMTFLNPLVEVINAIAASVGRDTVFAPLDKEPMTGVGLIAKSGGFAESLFHPGAALLLGALWAVGLGLTMHFIQNYDGWNGIMAGLGTLCGGALFWMTMGAAFTLKDFVHGPGGKLRAIAVVFIPRWVWVSVKAVLNDHLDTQAATGYLWWLEVPMELFYLIPVVGFSLFFITLVTMTTDRLKRLANDEKKEEAKTLRQDSNLSLEDQQEGQFLIEHVREASTATSYSSLSKQEEALRGQAFLSRYNFWAFWGVLFFSASAYLVKVDSRILLMNPLGFNNTALNNASLSDKNTVVISYWIGWGGLIGLSIVFLALWLFTGYMQTEARVKRTRNVNWTFLMIALAGLVTVMSVWANGLIKEYEHFTWMSSVWGGCYAVAEMTMCMMMCLVNETWGDDIRVNNMHKFNAMVLYGFAEAVGNMGMYLIARTHFDLAHMQTPLITSASLMGASMLCWLISILLFKRDFEPNSCCGRGKKNNK